MDRNVATVYPVFTLSVLSEGGMADGWREPASDVVSLDARVRCSTSRGMRPVSVCR